MSSSEETIFFMVCDFIATLKMGRLYDFVCIFLYVVPVDVIPVAFAEKNIFVLWICISCHHYLNIYAKLFVLRPLMLLLLFVH